MSRKTPETQSESETTILPVAAPVPDIPADEGTRPSLPQSGGSYVLDGGDLTRVEGPVEGPVNALKTES